MHHASASTVGARRHVRRALLAAALALAAAPASAQMALATPVPPLAALAARAETPSPALLIPVAGITAEQLHDSYHAGEVNHLRSMLGTDDRWQFIKDGFG